MGASALVLPFGGGTFGNAGIAWFGLGPALIEGGRFKEAEAGVGPELGGSGRVEGGRGRVVLALWFEFVGLD